MTETFISVEKKRKRKERIFSRTLKAYVEKIREKEIKSSLDYTSYHYGYIHKTSAYLRGYIITKWIIITKGLYSSVAKQASKVETLSTLVDI